MLKTNKAAKITLSSLSRSCFKHDLIFTSYLRFYLIQNNICCGALPSDVGGLNYQNISEFKTAKDMRNMKSLRNYHSLKRLRRNNN